MQYLDIWKLEKGFKSILQKHFITLKRIVLENVYVPGQKINNYKPFADQTAKYFFKT